ncbi:hypothetical protein K469DRAFT_696165 [Zopfia rhizophila CBS 207.26]|uniref:Hydrophobic surface binding protein A-domain-containing protein n=1 Tax=Zopfia rhizophila CBS 207.26 TaxID=1314779 RepID=A0A6A6DKF4_9PEZI|nr:hypothetical protein K469DRAFT_696165 [Zopfia rhizophila CBS 207.26]
MRFATLLPILPLTLALPHVPRQQSRAADVLQQISELSTSVADLTAAVDDFDGSLLGLLPQSLKVIATETKLDATILKTTSTVKMSGNFTDAESTQVVGALAGLVDPISKSLDALKAKYPTFKKVLEAPIVLLDLKILKKHTGELITALTEKVTPSSASLLTIGSQIINKAFDDAIAVYEGS